MENSENSSEKEPLENKTSSPNVNQFDINKADGFSFDQKQESDKKEKSNEIRNILNIDKLSGDISFGGNPLNFYDPTKSYHPNKSGSELIGSKTAQKYVKVIQESRIIMVHTVSPNLLAVATSSLILAINSKKAYDPRILELRDKNFIKQESDDNDDSFRTPVIDDLLDDRTGKGRSEIFLVDMSKSTSAERFLSTLIFEIEKIDNQITKRLIDRDTYIICRFSSQELIDKLQKSNPKNFFYEWELDLNDYLESLISTFFSEIETKDIYNHIIEQQKYGFYGDKETFEKEMSKLIEKGEQSIRSTIYGNINEVKNIKEKGGYQIDKITTQELLLKSPVAKELLYVASFFPDLHLREFSRIVRFILDGKKCSIEIEEEFITKKGKKKFLKKESTVSSLDYFLKKPDHALQEVHLEEIIGEEQKTIIDFNKAYLRKEVKAYFQSNFPTYCEEQFYDIVRYNFLFDDIASYNLVNNIIKLVVEVALSDPSYYGRELLVYGILRIEKNDKNVSDDENNDNAYKEKNEKEEIINALSAFLEKQHKLDRLALLISEFLEHDSLKKVVNDFLGSLIQIWKKPEVLLSILKRLKYDTNINQIFWLKRIFNEAPENMSDVKRDANTFFIALGKKATVEIFDLLEEIKEWWPETNKNSKLKHHNIYGLAFLYHYSISSIDSFNTELYGEFPSKYFLFAKWTELESKEVKEKIKFVTEWLFHPYLEGFSYNIKEKQDKKKFDLFDIKSNADLIEYWGLILLGNTKKPKPNPKAKELLKLILRQVRKSIDRTTQGNIRSAWSQKSQYYLTEGATLSFQEQTIRKLLIYRRNNLKKIIKYFDNQ